MKTALKNGAMVALMWTANELLWPVRLVLRGALPLALLCAFWSWWVVPTVHAELAQMRTEAVGAAKQAATSTLQDWLKGIPGHR